MTAALLEAAGVRTGSYLSPHLDRFAERIRIGDEDLSGAAFGAAIQRAAAAAAKVDRTLSGGERVTQFELLTAAALDELARSGVEVAVVEAGLGGRWDATNVLDAGVCVLTNVGLEHTRWLGPTVADIAREKLAVVRPSATLVLGDVDAEVLELAEQTGARIVRPEPLDVRARGYQRTNFGSPPRRPPPSTARSPPTQVAEVAARVRVPGRMQVVGEDPLTILDGAHNPSGMAALAAALDDATGTAAGRRRQRPRRQGRRGHAPRADWEVCGDGLHRLRNPRALPPATLAYARRARSGGPSTEVVRDPHAAVERARELAGPTARCSRRARSTWWPTSSARPPAGGPRRCERRARPERAGDDGARRRRRGPRDPRLLRPRLRFRSRVPVKAPGYASPRMLSFGIFGITNDGLNQGVSVLLLVLIVIWAALVFWTYADARRRIDDPMLIGCATAASLFPFVGTIVYVIVRPPEYLDDVRLRELEMTAAEARLAELDYQLCPHCDYEVKGDYLRCPSCMRKLKDSCFSCGKPIDPAWKLCPFCEAETGASTPSSTRRRRRSATTDQPTVAAEAAASSRTDELRPDAAQPSPERQVDTLPPWRGRSSSSSPTPSPEA